MPLIIEALRIEDGDTPIPVTRPSFSSIQDMINTLPVRGLGVIWGHAIREEIHHYADSLAIVYNGGALVGSTRYSVRADSARLSYQYARNRYKVESFLWRSVPSKPTINIQNSSPIVFEDIFDFAAAATWQQLVALMKPFYSATRRVKTGIEDDIESYLTPFRNLQLQYNIVAIWGHSPTFEDLILLWLFYHSKHNIKMVVASEGNKPRWIGSNSVIDAKERPYIKLDELISSASAYLSRSEASVNAAFGIWQRGVDPLGRSLIKRGVISEVLADAFLEAYAPIVAEDETATLGIIVPHQQPAPLRFKTVEGGIDLLDESEMQPNEPRVLGAVRSALGALEDLTSYTGFSNTIPTFSNRAVRIKNILTEMGEGNFDDDLVVQLGTEVNSLENRISLASDIISESAAAEAATFFPMVEGLLLQFRIWGEYKTKSQSRAGSSASTQAAVEILELSQERSDIVSGRARDRISSYVGGIETGSAEGEVGALLTAENIAAQAASAIAQRARETGQPISRRLARAIQTNEARSLSGWMIENKSELLILAEAGNVAWLKTFITALNTDTGG
ncbi:MAG: hypothetical protein PSV23_11195 [Brevundimonas sp.]|uniref:hypothetical protein n=1 Tax=Brevundimonas sp. TaxID=1871086 RepID=UPI0024870BD9|nr:hypothetical protein [Brevundimonas sp.]MDI1327351.1 hypothetical protein [Brevundimonas sp.]